MKAACTLDKPSYTAIAGPPESPVPAGVRHPGLDLSGLPQTLPADHHDDGGDVRRGAADDRLRRRCGIAPPARAYDRRRAAGQPAADPLHDTRDLSLLDRLRLWMRRPWRIRQRQPADEGLLEHEIEQLHSFCNFRVTHRFDCSRPG